MREGLIWLFVDHCVNSSAAPPNRYIGPAPTLRWVQQMMTLYCSCSTSKDPEAYMAWGLERTGSYNSRPLPGVKDAEHLYVYTVHWWWGGSIRGWGGGGILISPLWAPASLSLEVVALETSWSKKARAILRRCTDFDNVYKCTDK